MFREMFRGDGIASLANNLLVLDVLRNVFWTMEISFICLENFLDDRNVFYMFREMCFG